MHQVYATRIALSGKGLPSDTSSSGGYSLLDNQGISTSQFQEQTDFKRAMEGELLIEFGIAKSGELQFILLRKTSGVPILDAINITKETCGNEVGVRGNPAVQLGAVLAGHGAARAGADVTGIDIAPRLLAQARAADLVQHAPLKLTPARLVIALHVQIERDRSQTGEFKTDRRGERPLQTLDHQHRTKKQQH